MGFSVTSAARGFDQSAKTGADLKKFWSEDPAGAATWLSEVARGSTNAPPALAELAKAAKLNAPADQLQAIVTRLFTADQGLFDSIGTAIATAQAQAAGQANMGWTAAPAAAGAVGPAADALPTAANFVGHLQKNDQGVVQFKTATGTYDVDLSTTDWREEIETAFMRDKNGQPQLMTMKGFPSVDGKRIYAQQFAPGSDPNFIAARVRVEGDKVYLATIGWGASDKIEVTNPEFKKLLKGDDAQGLANYSPAGMILPGNVKTDPQTGAKTYDENPQAFFILGRTMHLDVGSDEKYDYHELDTGYFKATGARAPKGMTVPDASKPGGAKWDATDTSTHGSTTDTTGPRAFFYAKILPLEEKFPEVAKFTRTLQRRIEITAVSDQGDNGIHSPSSSPMSNDFATLAKTVPASAPEHTAAQGTLDPADD